MRRKNVKKVIVGICILATFFQTACSSDNDKNKEVSYKSNGTDEREDIDYTQGYYTKDLYVNESVGIKFRRPQGFRFINTDNELDNTSKQSEEKGNIRVEALCKGAGSNITFFSCKVGKDVTIDIAANEFLNGIDLVDSRQVDLEDVHDQRREDVKIEGKTYRLIEISASKNDAGMVMTCYLRIIGNYLFVIEVADVLSVSTLKGGANDVIKNISTINKKDNIIKIKKDAINYKKRLKLEEKKSQKDPCIEEKEGVYVEGEIDNNDIYYNKWAGFSFRLPIDATYTKMKDSAEMEATTRNLFCCTYVTSEYIGNNYTMDEYIRNITGVSKNMKLRVISNSKKEKMMNKWWRVIVIDTGKKTADNKKIVQRLYTRFVGTQAIQISFLYIQGQERAVSNMKKAYVVL